MVGEQLLVGQTVGRDHGWYIFANKDETRLLCSPIGIFTQ